MGTSLSATFSEALTPSSVNVNSFSLFLGFTPVSATVSLDAAGKVATLYPTTTLAYASVYTAVISTAVKDLAGNWLASEYRWSFTTAIQADTTRPTVVSVMPLSGATNVSIATRVSAVFSKQLSSSSVTSLSALLYAGTLPISCTVQLDTPQDAILITPVSQLSYSTTYTAVITTSVKDLVGNSLASEYRWSFTTAVQPDTTRPTVTSTSPSANVTDIPITTQVVAFFSEPVTPATTNASSYKVYAGTTEVSGTVSLDSTNKILTFAPVTTLAYATLLR
ncbi:MAG: Ig-like domain-containing protein [Candidatus Jorgensenbacteria bacterium]|nr:Ig-like domain-containing protein [Candidatus Jorgensenbacteria bacterium]